VGECLHRRCLAIDIFPVSAIPAFIRHVTVYNQTGCGTITLSRVEAGSNTSTVALRVVGGDENGTQCLGV
jgi:hypothetical protein